MISSDYRAAAWQHIGMQVFHNGGNIGLFARICKATQEVVRGIFEDIKQINNSQQLQSYVSRQSYYFQKNFEVWRVDRLNLEKLQKKDLDYIAFLITEWSNQYRSCPFTRLVIHLLCNILQTRQESPENVFMCALLGRNRELANKLLPHIDVCRITTDPRKGLHYRTTPLHVAAEVGNVGIIEQLVERGLSLHGLDQQGGTPLHRTKFLLVARELVRLGGRDILYTENRDGQTPLEALISLDNDSYDELIEEFTCLEYDPAMAGIVITI